MSPQNQKERDSSRPGDLAYIQIRVSPYPGLG